MKFDKKAIFFFSSILIVVLLFSSLYSCQPILYLYESFDASGNSIPPIKDISGGNFIPPIKDISGGNFIPPIKDISIGTPVSPIPGSPNSSIVGNVNQPLMDYKHNLNKQYDIIKNNNKYIMATNWENYDKKTNNLKNNIEDALPNGNKYRKKIDKDIINLANVSSQIKNTYANQYSQMDSLLK